MDWSSSFLPQFKAYPSRSLKTDSEKKGKENMKKVALYARVSTADQSSGLESQIRALRDHCDKNGITNYELFTDENISGAKVSPILMPGRVYLLAAFHLQSIIKFKLQTMV